MVAALTESENVNDFYMGTWWEKSSALMENNQLKLADWFWSNKSFAMKSEKKSFITYTIEEKKPKEYN